MFLNDRNKEIDLHNLQYRISNEDHAAFASLFELFNKRLVTFSRSLVHSKETAEDVVEDVFVKVWSKRHTIHTIDNLAVYLYVAVKNLSLNKISEKARQMITQPFDDIEPQVEALAENPYSLLITSEMLGKMNKAVEELPPRCKMIFKLVREDGLRYKEVAQILNISVNTIDVQMAIAVKRICEALGITKESLKKPSLSFRKKN